MFRNILKEAEEYLPQIITSLKKEANIVEPYEVVSNEPNIIKSVEKSYDEPYQIMKESEIETEVPSYEAPKDIVEVEKVDELIEVENLTEIEAPDGTRVKVKFENEKFTKEKTLKEIKEIVEENTGKKIPFKDLKNSEKVSKLLEGLGIYGFLLGSGGEIIAIITISASVAQALKDKKEQEGGKEYN